jgi:hypothetical protein
MPMKRDIRDLMKFYLPEIPPDERIRHHGAKSKKHATKRRRNKLHDKRR